MSFAFAGILGCPHPPLGNLAGGVPPPPPPPVPAAPYTTFSAATGTVRNGPSYFAGFKVTAQTAPGPIVVYNGPDASYPVVQSIPSPVLGEWYYAELTTDPADPTTWFKSISLWATIGGVGQAVDWACRDFVGSQYASGTQAGEFARITAAYTGTTYYWKAKGAGGAGTGTIGDPWNGARALQNALAAGVPDWSIVQFDYVNGPCTIASDGADWPCTTAINTQINSNSANQSGTVNPAGIIFGSNLIGTSNASRIWFKFDSTQYAADWTGAVSATRRAIAAMRFQGQEIVITGLKFKMPNWSPLIDPITKAVRVPGSGASADAVGNSQADLRSFENCGLIAFGNGNHIHNCYCEGSYEWQRYGIANYVAEDGVPGATPGLRGSLSYCTSIRCQEGFKVQPFGSSGYDLEVPTGIDVHHNITYDPGFGRNATYLPAGPGNSMSHGNGFGLQGKFFGGMCVYANEVYGAYQDAFAGVSTGTVVYDNYVHQLGTAVATITEWYWTGTIWDTRSFANVEGNAFKLGLGNKDLRSPTTWLGTDGVAMTDAIAGTTDHLGVAEIRWICVRNIVDECNAAGVTTNESNGAFIAYNEFYDPKGQGILFHGANKTAAQARQCNIYIMNNFIQKVTSGGAGGTACIRFEQRTNNAKRVWMYNNILWCNHPTVATHLELFVESGVTFVDSRKNVLVKGRISGVYSTANDLTDAGSIAAAQLYTRSVAGNKAGAGLPGGSVLLNAGYAPAIANSRTYGCFTNFKGDPVNTATPNVGPV